MLDCTFIKDKQIYLQKVREYKYALIYMLSEVKLINWQEYIKHENLNWDEVIEARFFDENGEIHIFDFNGKKVASEALEKNVRTDVIDTSYILTKKFSTIGENLCVRQYIDYDEDGQSYVALTRLYDVKGGFM